jgi:hypothetical protein
MNEVVFPRLARCGIGTLPGIAIAGPGRFQVDRCWNGSMWHLSHLCVRLDVPYQVMTKQASVCVGAQQGV